MKRYIVTGTETRWGQPDLERVSRARVKVRASRSRRPLALLLALLFGLFLLITSLWLLGHPAALRAAGPPIRYVALAPWGDNTNNDCSSRHFPCATIQWAVSQADPGDEIRVAGGTYAGTVALNQELTLRGGFTVTNWFEPDPAQYRTVIDGQGSNRALNVGSSISATVRGFDITGGQTASNGDGAGIANLGHLTLLESRVYENTAGSGGVGGGIYSAGSAWLFVQDTEISSNTADYGGGFYVDTNGTGVIEGGQIFANVATVGVGGGGAMDGNGALRSVLIYDNSAATNGGGLSVDGETVQIQNGTFYANFANWNGGGVNAWNGVITITNSLFVSNTTGLRGGGIYSNTTDLDVNYSDFFANSTHIENSSGLINPSEAGQENYIRDPQFVDPSSFDLHLSAGSQAIGSGTSVAAVTTDFEGHGRPFGSGYDRGGDEFISSSDCYARLDHGQVYTDVQAAVDAASAGSLVQVAGRCTGVEARDGTSQTVYLDQSVTLRGGYTVTNWSSPRYGPTVLDAQGLGRVVFITATAEITPRIENLHLTGGYVAGFSEPGAGVYVGPNVDATLENNVVFENDAYNGGGVAVDTGATATLRHNTLYGNTAQRGAGVYAHGIVFLEDSAVVTNTAASDGGGIFEAGGGSFILAYNDFYGNTPDNYGGTAITGTTDVNLPPGFVDAVGGDFHLDYAHSEIINRADPASPVATDFEGDARPLGLRSDVGADESWYYADLLLGEAPETPVVVTDTGQIENTLITFTHVITNLGSTPSPTDTFDIVTDNTDGWDVTLVGISSPVVVTEGVGISFQVVVSVSTGLSPTLYNETFITATSRTNDAVQAAAVDTITTPGMDFFPDHTQSADPGEVVTYTHTLINTGDGEDTFTLVLNSSRGWSQLVEPAPVVTDGLTTTVTLAPGESASVVVRVEVPTYVKAGLQDVTTIKSISGFSSEIYVTVVDTTTANSITGDRYVATVGDNLDNNCTQPISPCATINYAIGQSAQGDSILVAQGEYFNAAGTQIDIDLGIQLLGGYEFANGAFSPPSGGVDPTTTIINANSGRGIQISVSPAFHPVVEGFTIKDGDLSGVGGGIYVQGSSAPTLTHLIIMDSTGTQGGGIYVDEGDPVIQQVTISNTVASGGGGGIYVNEGSPTLEDVVISGASANRGGGLYVLNGNITASGLHIADNEATEAGGGVYHAAGTVVLSQTHIMGNRASTGGGFYGAGGSLTLWNNFIYSNTATTWSGGGIYKDGGTLELVNDTLYANTAQTYGGGVYDGNSLSMVISNTILAENVAGTGGGLYRDSTGSLTMGYNDFWSNIATTHPDSNVSIGAHSVTIDPLFVDPAAGDLHLSPDSPVVDAGDPDTFLNYDIDGEMRPINQGYDIGADELGGCLARVVTPGSGEQVGPIYGVVQEAIDAADPGYIVQVAGVCRGVLPRVLGGQVISQTAFISKSLVLEGGYESGFGDPGTGVATSVLDAEGLGRAVVVTGSVHVQITHLTMADGDATGLGGGPAGADAGGGVYNRTDLVLRIEDSVISDSVGTYGGGLYSFGGTLVLSSTTGMDDIQVAGNTATYGGGMFLGGGTPMLRSVDFLENTAEQGGGIYNAGAVSAITDTEFYSNTAEVGGGLYNATGSLEGTGLAFTENSASSGGGVYNGGDAPLQLMRSVFLSNTVVNDGGGIYNALAGDLYLANTILAANQASNDGGGLFNRSDDLELRHSTFYANHAGDQGGGIYHDAVTGTPVINSTLIVGNSAGTAGSGIYSASADPDFDYNDVFNNTYGGNLNAGDGDGNLAVDPDFISTDPASPYFLRLPPNSPAEDVADPASPVLLDIDGDPRPTNQGFDIGADEVGGCYVRINGEAPTYGNIQFAARDSDPGDTLHVAGTCLGVNAAVDNSQTVSQTVFLTKSLNIRGGYTTTNWTEPDPEANVTTLDALGMGRVVYVTNSSVVSITGLYLGRGSGNQGGAVFVRNGVLTMTHNHIYSSTATHGGALYNQGGSVFLVQDNALFANSAMLGGGVYNAGGHFTLDDTLWYDNQATDGGAFYYASGNGVFQNNVVRNNQATGDGGGVYNGGNGLTVRHNTFYRNAATNGGALYTENATPAVVNNLFVENSAGAGDAVYSDVALSIDYNDVYPEAGAYANVTPGPNSLAVDPLLVNPTAGNFHLQDDSPVIDQGDPTMTLLHDFDGDLRPGDQGFDMGADERRSCYARIVRTGVVYGNIQRAVDHSLPDDVIQVTIGECRGVNTYIDGGQTLSQTVHITHDLTLRGGFDDAFTTQCQGPQGYPDLVCATTFDPEGLGRAVLVTHTAVITLDRFNLVYGDATGLGGGIGDVDAGGGLYFNGPEGTLTHVDFYSNTATYGGAFYNAGDQVLMENSWIHYNTAEDGGAIYNATGVLTVAGQTEASILTDNEATNQGGALFNAAGQVWVIGNHLDNALGMLSLNQALQGGAIYNDDGTMIVDENTISENEADDGGAIYNATGTITLTLNQILDNRALTGGRGGGFFNDTGTATLDLGNHFDGNISGGSGGAIYSAGGDLIVWNQLIYNNNATNQGGGIYVHTGTPSILHNTLYRNTVSSGVGNGGGVYAASGANPTIKNTIFYSNVATYGGGIYVAGSATVDYNNFYENSANHTQGVATGANSLVDVDPQLANPGGGDFHLTGDSPLIDQAQDSAVWRDFEADPRPVNQGADIGADELSSCLARVSSSGIIYGRIQTAVDNAISGDTIKVAEGVCEETVTIDRDLTISGSWTEEFSKQSDNIATTIDALRQNRVITVTGTVDRVNLSYLEIISGSTTADGGGIWSGANRLTLDTVDIWANSGADGGGLYVDGGQLSLVEVGINGNQATGSGGGVYLSANVTATQEAVLFFGNQALSGHGGGEYVGTDSLLEDLNGGMSFNTAGGNGGGLYVSAGCEVDVGGGFAFDYNEADNGGGAYIAGASFTLAQKRFNYNDATSGHGGGIYASGSSVLDMTNLGLFSNSAALDGGGLYHAGSGDAALYHATIRANDAVDQGGGVYHAASSMVISASIVASNTASSGAGIYGASNVNYAYGLRWNNDYVGVSIDPSTTNLVADPRFRPDSWGDGGDLLYTSPAIDMVPAGDSHVVVDRFLQSRVPLGPNGNPQSHTPICAKDMGRDEFVVQRNMGWTDIPDDAVILPSESVTHTFSLQNQGVNVTSGGGQVSQGIGSGYTETVTVTVNSSKGWARIEAVEGASNVQILPGQEVALFELGPGDTADIQVVVTVPPGTYASVEDRDDTKEFTSISYETVLCANGPELRGSSADVVTRVGQDWDFLIGPDRSGAAMPGQTITYTHIVTNIGNLTDTYTIYPNSGYYASGEIAQPSPPELTLTPQQTGTVVISVTIDPEAAGGLVDVTNIIAQSTTGKERGAADSTAISYTTGTRYVALNGSDSLVPEQEGDPDAIDYLDNNCTQPDAGACRTIRHAIDQAADGDEIHVAYGTFTGTYTTTYQTQVVTQVVFVDKPVVLRGGYDAADWDEDPPDHHLHPTRLDAQGLGRGIFIADGISVTVDRMVLVNGSATGLGGGPADADAGGNLYNAGADLTLTANRIYSGTAALGGGLYSHGGDLLLQNDLLHHNQATDQGGAVYVYTGTATLENNTFFTNTATNQGAALYAADGSATISNTIFAGNVSGSGGVVHAASAASAVDYALYYNNDPSHVGGTVPALDMYDVEADPQFVAPATMPPDLHLQNTSPAKDAGDPDTTLDIDYDNYFRPLGPGFDIGAYERVPVQGMSFYSDHVTTTVAGVTVFFTHTLENTGDTTETFTIDATNDLGWTIELEQPVPYEVILGPGARHVVPVTITVPSDAGGQTGRTTITATGGPPRYLSESVVNTVHVRAPAWQIDKTVTPSDVIQPGGYLTYTLTVTNNGNLATSGTFTITDPLPDHTHFVWSDTPTDATHPDVIWTLSDQLGVGETLSVTFVVSVTQPLTNGTPIVNQDYRVSGGGAPAEITGDPVTVWVVSTPDLEIDKVASADSVAPGDWLTYTLTVTNTDAALGAAEAVVIRDTLPDELVYSSMGFVPPATGSLDDSGTPELVWTLDDPIPVGESVQLTVTGRITSPLAPDLELLNTCAVTATHVSAWIEDTLTTTVNATNEITLTKSVAPDLASTGEVVTYTVILTNTGDGVASVTLTDTLESDFSPAVFTTNLTVPGRTWDTSEGVTTVVFTATAPVTGGVYLNPDVTVAYDSEQVSIVDTAPVTVVQGVASLSLTSDSPTLLGTDTTFTITLAAGSGVSYTLAYGYGGDTLTGTLVAGIPTVVTYTYPATGTYTAIVTATNAVSQLEDTTVVEVQEELADLVITDMWLEPTSLAAGEPISVHVTVLNQGWTDTVQWDDPLAHGFWVEIYAKGSSFTPAGPPVDVFDHAGGYAEGGMDYLGWAALDRDQEVELVYQIVLTPTDVYTFYAQADVGWESDPIYQSFGQIRETNEENNIYTYGPAEVEPPERLIYVPLVLREE